MGRAPWRPKFGASFWVVTPLVVVFTIAGVASGGLGGLLLAWGLVALATALYSVVTGRAGWASVPGRKVAAVVLAVSLVVMGVGATLLPPRADESLASAESPASKPTQTPKPTVTDAPAPEPEPVASPTTQPAASGGDSTALALLATLPVKGKSPMTGHDRTGMFGSAWLDVDRNGCDTRNDIRQRDFASTVRSGPCKVTSGVLVSPYTGETINFVRGNETSMAVQIDHVVALANAWQTGAQQLSQDQRIAFANDPMNLFAVDGASNSQKGAGDTATWLPKSKSFRCTYVSHQVSVKAAYGLWVTKAEHEAMTRVLSSCADAPTVFEPVPVPVVAPVAPEPAPVASGCDTNYYGACVPIASDVGCAGGSGNGPEYVRGPVTVVRDDIYGLDMDGDGIAC
ncbi:HNH endonuclease family protein [Homoserinimonas sp. A447]